MSEDNLDEFEDDNSVVSEDEVTNEGEVVELKGTTTEDKEFLDNADDNIDLINSYNKQKEYGDDEGLSSESEEEGNDLFKKMKRFLYSGHESDIKEGVQLLQGYMHEIAERDRKHYSSNSPAYEKTAAIDSIFLFLSYEKIGKQLLEGHILSAIEQWLLPYPDSTLVSHKVRENLYEILSKLPVDKDDIYTSNCKIGQLVLKLYQHPDEDFYYREKLRKILDKWIRLFYSKSNNYKDIGEENITLRSVNMSQKTQTSKELFGLPDEVKSDRHAVVPRKYMDVFSRNVKQSTSLSQASNRSNTTSSATELKRGVERTHKRKRQQHHLPQMNPSKRKQ